MGCVELHSALNEWADECPQVLAFLDEQRITARAGSFPSVRPVRRGRCGSDTYSGCLERGFETLVRGACKSWKCEYCAELKAEKYRRGITRLAKEHDLATFMTLTLDRKKIRGNMVDYINRVWTRMNTRLRRGFHLKHASPYVTVLGLFPYVRVLELQRDGVPHFHILLPRWVMDDDKWFVLEVRKAWEACGGGAQTDVQVVEIRDIGGYVTKAMASYLTKESFLEGIRDGARRVTTSVGLRISERSGVGTWVRYTTSITDLYAQRMACGSVVRFGSETRDAWGDLCRVEFEMPRDVRTPAEVYFGCGDNGDVVIWERSRRAKSLGAICAPLPGVEPLPGAHSTSSANITGALVRAG
jgi:hypothetical protein